MSGGREKTRRELTGERRGWVVAQTKLGRGFKKATNTWGLSNHSVPTSRLVYVSAHAGREIA